MGFKIDEKVDNIVCRSCTTSERQSQKSLTRQMRQKMYH